MIAVKTCQKPTKRSSWPQDAQTVLSKNPFKAFGQNSLPQCWRGTRIGESGSYQVPGPKAKNLSSEPDKLQKANNRTFRTIHINRLRGHYWGGVCLPSTGPPQKMRGTEFKKVASGSTHLLVLQARRVVVWTLYWKWWTYAQIKASNLLPNNILIVPYLVHNRQLRQFAG